MLEFTAVTHETHRQRLIAFNRLQTHTATNTTYKVRTNAQLIRYTHIHNQPDTSCAHRHIQHTQTPTETHTQFNRQLSLTETKASGIHIYRHGGKQIHKTDFRQVQIKTHTTY